MNVFPLTFIFLITFINYSFSFMKDSLILKLSPINSKLFKLDMVKVMNVDDNTETEIDAGSPLSLAAVRTNLRLSFQCKAGHCSSCEMLLDGKKVLTCQTKVPNKKVIKIKRVKK